MTNDDFFGERTQRSEIKMEIVKKYFLAWANVMIGYIKKYPQRYSGRIAYIDLFAGQGHYDDGTPSTPILVLSEALKKPEISSRLISRFNDANPKYANSLNSAIQAIPNINQMKHQPIITNEAVDDELARIFETIKFDPALFFFDPFGYKGLSLKLLASVIKDFGCDCIFFFNYKRINAALQNMKFNDHMNALFGRNRANDLKVKLVGLKSIEREDVIMRELYDAIKEIGGDFMHPFRFMDVTGNRTSHHLIFVSKHIRGYEIMKNITAKCSSSEEQGVPNYEFAPPRAEQIDMFPAKPLDDLKTMLLEEFEGNNISVKKIMDKHKVGRPFKENHYKQVLKELEFDGQVQIAPPAAERRRDTLKDDAIVTFPRKKV